jgi:hypothetical protein
MSDYANSSDHRIGRRRFLRAAAASTAGALLAAGGAAAASTAGSLLAAGGAANPAAAAPAAKLAGKPGVLRAGAAARKVTPKVGVSLRGYILQGGPVKTVHDDLNSRAIVVDDGQTRLAIVVTDMTTIPDYVFSRAKELAEKRTGIPQDRMLMTATHTHSSPRMGIDRNELDIEYEQFVAAQIAAAVGEACENLTPARIGWGVGEKPELVCTRRWLMKPGTIPPDPFGRTDDKVRFIPPAASPDMLEPAGPVDPAVSVLSIQDAVGRPMALLANFGIHYAGGTKGGEVSADYFGVFARRMEETLGGAAGKPPFVAIMSNGTSGDVYNGTDLTKPRVAKPPYVHIEDMGKALAEKAMEIYAGIEHCGSMSVAMSQRDLELGVRKPDQVRLEWAKKILADEKAKTPHGWSRVYAKDALRLAEYPDTVPVRLQAVRIGELGIGASPCEMFAETGLAIKAASPLKPTFVMELANQYNGYLPTRRQHELGGYETWDARSSHLEIDAEAKIRAGILELLRAVANA